MNNLYAAIIALAGWTKETNGPSGQLFVICSLLRDNASSTTFTGNPFTVLKAQILASAGSSFGYHLEGLEETLSGYERRYAATH